MAAGRGLHEQGAHTGTNPGFADFGGAAGQLRRLLLRTSSQEPQVQDLTNAAELALNVGLCDAAAALYGFAFLKTGPVIGTALRNAVDARTGLWALPQKTVPPPQHAFSVDAAIAELKPLLDLDVTIPSSSPDISAVLEDDGIIPKLKTPQDADRTLEVATRVTALFRDFPRLQSEGQLGPELRLQAAGILSHASLRLESNVHQPLATLISLFLLDQARRFLVYQWHLLFAEPSALFEEASNLNIAALGPYFFNVRLIIRNVHDLFGLIGAASDLTVCPDSLETWAILLSSGLDDGETLTLIDELADRGMGRALQAVLARMALRRQAKQSLEIAWRLRDAGIDICSDDLAVNAQRLVVHWKPASGLEWMTLGDLLGARRATLSAEQAYKRASTLDGNLPGMPDRLEELKAGLPRQIVKGYGTSARRHALRQARFASNIREGSSATPY